MKKTAFIVIALIGLLSAGCKDQRRYEIVCAPFTLNNNTYIGMRVLDTFTGDVWLYTGLRANQDSNWIYSGNPTRLKLK